METTRTINIKPAGWHRQKNRRNLLQRMEILEQAFARCNKMEHPQEWLRLQDELGNIYHEVMANVIIKCSKATTKYE